MNKGTIIKCLVFFLVALIIGLITSYFFKPKENKTENKIYYDTFISIEERTGKGGTTIAIVYDKDTKVMYYLTRRGLAPIYNPDGTIQVYKE